MSATNARNRPAKPKSSTPEKMQKKPFLFIVQSGGMDFTFLILVLLLLAIGLVMLFSASYPYAYYNRGNSFEFISSQSLYAVLGIVLMLFISTLNYRILENLATVAMGFSLFLLVIVLFFPHDGARRWIDLGFITFQPSEVAKFTVVILFAAMINKNYDKMKDFRHGVVPFIAVLGVVSILMLMEPHLSGTVLILAIGAIMMIVGGTDMKWFFLAAALAIAGLVVIVATGAISYAMPRITSWLDPFSDPRGDGFQTIQSLFAIGSGGLMGTGIGNSRQKYLYLPEPQNDFIFAIVCEELGFVGAVGVILLFALLVWRGFVIAMRCRDRFGSLVAVGLTAQVGVQAILNIMVVTNTIPNTGISLPFFSAGGTALIMLLAQMGVILSISRHATMVKE
jgi:cell division protein FtsW